MNDRTENNSDYKFDNSMLDITDEKFEEFMKSAVNMAEISGLGHKSMIPHIISFQRPFVPPNLLGDIEATVFGIAGDFNESEEKRTFLRLIGASIRDSEKVPIAVFLITEAWLSTLPASTPATHKVIQPRYDPNKKEALTIAGRTFTGDCYSATAIIVERDADDNMQKVDTIECAKGKRISTSLLDEVFNGFLSDIKVPDGFLNAIKGDNA